MSLGHKTYDPLITNRVWRKQIANIRKYLLFFLISKVLKSWIIVYKGRDQWVFFLSYNVNETQNSVFSSKTVNNVSGIFLRVRGQRSVKSRSLVHVCEGGGGASAPADKVQAMRVTPPALPPRLTLSLAPAWPRITSSFQLISLNCTIFITYRKRLHFVSRRADCLDGIESIYSDMGLSGSREV